MHRVPPFAPLSMELEIVACSKIDYYFWTSGQCCFGASAAHPLLFAIHATSDFLSVMASSGDVAVRNGSHGINGAHGIKGAHGYSREETLGQAIDHLIHDSIISDFCFIE